jgi:urea transport system permease protein
LDVILSPLFTGTAIGAVLLLAALGLSLTFGQMGVINMAHGEFMMAGAYTAFLVQQVISPQISILVALPVGFVVGGLLGLLLEVTVIRWMYDRPLDTFLVTIGVGLVLQQVARDLFGARAKEVKTPTWLHGHISVLGIDMPANRLFIIALALAGVVGVGVLMRRTALGRRLRATVQNRDLAETVGISTAFADRATFFVGSGLAGVAGVALTLVGATGPTLGTEYILGAFLVVVVGGVGQIKGTVIAAFSFGIVQAFFEAWTDGPLAKVVVYLAIVAFLQWRPQGLFTVRTRSLA